jgi:hypothetical protein
MPTTTTRLDGFLLRRISEAAGRRPTVPPPARVARPEPKPAVDKRTR